MKQFALLCLLFLSACGVEESATKGYPVNLRFASSPVLVKSVAITTEEIESYMRRLVPNWSGRPQTANILATAIQKVAEDFAIDARLITGMIALESAFDARAVSPTGAVGLTQLTIPGIEEFLDQTGAVYISLGNATYAGGGTVFFQEAIKKSWPDFPTRRLLPDFAARTAWARQIKAETFAQRDRYFEQIVAGTTILKAAITYCCSKNGSCSIDAIREGLERYNGDSSLRPDGQMVKVYYAKDILKRVDQM